MAWCFIAVLKTQAYLLPFNIACLAAALISAEPLCRESYEKKGEENPKLLLG
jgi:hypothetical protein